MPPKRTSALARASVQIDASEAERLLRAKGEYSHIRVRSFGAHIVFEDIGDGPAWTIARITPLGRREFTAAFRNHSGRWEPLPIHGSLREVVHDLLDLLSAYFQPTTAVADNQNGPRTSGTNH